MPNELEWVFQHYQYSRDPFSTICYIKLLHIINKYQISYLDRNAPNPNYHLPADFSKSQAIHGHQPIQNNQRHWFLNKSAWMRSPVTGITLVKHQQHSPGPQVPARHLEEKFTQPKTTHKTKRYLKHLRAFPKNPSQMPRRWWYVFCFDLGSIVMTREKIHGHWILPPWHIGLTFASPGIRGDLPRQISHGGWERLLNWLVLPNFACHNLT